MARVGFVPASDLPADVGRIYEQYATGYGPFRSQVAVFAHVPSAVEHIMGLLPDLRRQGKLHWRDVQLAIVVTATLNAWHYYVAHHPAPLNVEGLSEAAIEMLPALHEELDAVDRLVVDYTVAVTNNAQRIPERMFE